MFWCFSPFFPRILKHLIGFRTAIFHRRLFHRAIPICLQSLAPRVDTLAGESEFGGQGLAAFPFAYPTHEQHRLPWLQFTAGKKRLAVQIVHGLTRATPIIRQSALGATKLTGLGRLPFA